MKGKMARKIVYSLKQPFIVGELLLDSHFTMDVFDAETVHLRTTIVIWTNRIPLTWEFVLRS